MRSRPLLTFFAIVFAITWSVAAMAILAGDWFGRTFGPMTPKNPMFFLAVYAPTLTSIVLTIAFKGTAGLRSLLSRLDPRRCHPIWYLVVLGGFIVVTGLSAWISSLTGSPKPVWNWSAAGGAFVGGLFLDPGPLGEELGWRGFALPRMLRRWSPLGATLLLGVIWGLWHLPAFYVSTLSQSQLSLPIFLMGALALSIVMAWLFLRSKGSVLVTILAHAAANHSGEVTGATFNQMVYGLTAVAILIIATRQLTPEPAAVEPAP